MLYSLPIYSELGVYLNERFQILWIEHHLHVVFPSSKVFGKQTLWCLITSNKKLIAILEYDYNK
jgi:hypothetical protein